MPKSLHRVTVTQLVYLDPEDYGTEDVEEMSYIDNENILEGGMSLDDVFDVTAETFNLKYEEA